MGLPSNKYSINHRRVMEKIIFLSQININNKGIIETTYGLNTII